MNLNDLRMSLKAALDNMWARIDARITAIEQGGGGGGVTGVKGNAEANYRTGNVNLTPANIGAVSTSDVIDIPHGGTGANSAAGARENFFPDDLSNESAAYLAGFTFNWAKGGWMQLPLPLPYGGTGANSAAEAISALFDVSVTQSSITSYPNAPGVYQVIGTNIFQHLSPASLYGTLIIIGRVYGAHFYIDSTSSLYVGHSGDTFGEPTTWRTCT